MSQEPIESGEIEAPKSIQIHQSDASLIITRKWLDRKTIIYTFVPIAIILFAIQPLFLISNFINNHFNETLQDIIRIEDSNEVIWLGLVALIGLLFLITGIFFVYYIITKWLNQTRIWANEEEILINHQPLPCPWIRNKRVRKANLERLYAKRNQKNQSYDIYANTYTGDDKKIITVATGKEALFIERTLEDYYNLEDQPQKGEIDPSNLTNPFHQIEAPRSITVYQDDNQIQINKKWNGGFITAIFAILLNTFLIIVALLVANSDNTGENISRLLPIFLLFLLFGILTLYLAVARWVNYTYIVADNKLITVTYGSVPFPFFKNQQIEASQLKRLYSKQYSSGENSYIYIVHIDTNQGSGEELVKVSNREEALFIERTLENYYNIEDQPQEGEISELENNVWDGLFGNQ
ncbi:hypothetical protein FRE64_03535 [Euhalothece natronophila Z-M001]|uniref:Uncharacterized protein n=1 Tax=Euhalothece natronophila Z-M001 TaxID=522448 RepID=A0A5B8NJE2_9CHRO|nr:hypothetical protein [Euhalothece natronophila]QDZ39087.1 hypothetical protein FRE64_03535 [Euhalothece natronophila Z-M001]